MVYQQLTLEETKEYLIAWREQHNEEALINLINCNYKLVYFFAHKYLNKNLSFDDLCSAGKEGLFKAINRFDYINHPIGKFSSYVSVAIDNQIKMDLRSYNKHNHEFSLEQSIDGSDLRFEEVVGTDSEQLIENIINNTKTEVIKNVLKCLTPIEKQIILLRYGFDGMEPKKISEVAEICSCSSNIVSKYQQKALIKMRRPGNIKKLKDFMEN